MDVTNSRPPGQVRLGGCFKTCCRQIRWHGFTLIELLAAIAISSILFGISLPKFASILDTNRLTSQINLLSAAMAYTRSVAILHNQAAVICKSANGTDCDTKAKWENGWIIYFDRDGNRKLETKNGDQILRVHGSLTASTLRYKAFGPRGYIAYQADGFTQTNGTFTLCLKNKPKIKKALILSKSGRLRVSQTGYGGKPLKCP